MRERVSGWTCVVVIECDGRIEQAESEGGLVGTMAEMERVCLGGHIHIVSLMRFIPCPTTRSLKC